ncbi:glycosyltransferase family 2 protein [Streptomyces sanyensis]|uniref:Glycosyltransferase 2-like domain-containing protein n=1 Tax=Streptomyces sanyensis TaxID=568869 RepID=A0ABP9BF70_9ACTN
MTTRPTRLPATADAPPSPDGHPLRRSTDPAPHPLRRAEDRTPPPCTVSLVVPARNEARNIPWVFEQIPDCVDEVLLIDGDSSDATVRMAAECMPGVRLLPQSGPGKGNALRTGFLAARGEYVVMMDADGSMSPAEIPHFLHFLQHGYDFVKGSRFVAGGGSLDLTRIRRLGNRGLLSVVNRLYGASLTDLCYGFCAFRRPFLDQLDLHAVGFEIEAEMIVHALRSGLRIAEVPSLELPRRSGSSNLHAVSDGTRILRTLLSERPGAHPRVPARSAP